MTELILAGARRWKQLEMENFSFWLLTQPLRKLNLQGNQNLNTFNMLKLIEGLEKITTLQELDLKKTSLPVADQTLFKKRLPNVAILF